MYRALLLVALISCKKDPAAGLPPSGDWKASEPGVTAPKAGATNPHAGQDMEAGGNPHAGMGADPNGGDNPHAGMGGGSDNPHAGMGSQVPNTMAQKTTPTELEKTADGRLVLGPFTLAAPKEWTLKPVTSNMRAAQFTWSDKAGEEAELVVYYFGEGGAGGVDANLDRWLGQFTQANGKPSKDVAKIEKVKLAGQDATVVSVAGHMSTSMPGGPAPVDVPDAMLLAAIVNSPKGPYYFKATGTKKSVEANAAKFRTMLASLKLK